MDSFSVSIDVEKDLNHAWEFYFNQISSWWPKEFYTSPNTKRFIIDTFIGGKVYEDHGEGGGLVWGDVIGVNYPVALQIRGNLTKEFGGPVVSYEKFHFEAIDGGTRLTYSVDFVGRINERSIKSLKDGWKDILNNHFKEYCANRE